MSMAVGLTVPKIGGGQMSEWSGYNETDYNSLKCNLDYWTRMYTKYGGLCSSSSCSVLMHIAW